MSRYSTFEFSTWFGSLSKLETNTFTIPSHLSVETEETNRDGIAPCGDVDKEHTHNPGSLGPDTKSGESRGAVSGL